MKWIRCLTGSLLLLLVVVLVAVAVVLLVVEVIIIIIIIIITLILENKYVLIICNKINDWLLQSNQYVNDNQGAWFLFWFLALP